MNRRITMADIARKAGVHVTTVSLALRNNPRLPQATRERIQAIAAEMDYRPDPAIASLVAYRHAIHRPSTPHPIAYVTGWHTQWGWKERAAHANFFEGASQRARQLGYELQHFWLRAPEMTDRRMCQILRARGINGLILASHGGASRAIDFEWEHFSAVQIDYLPNQPELHRVSNDQRCITQLAVRRVAARGFRRIGFVLPAWWDESMQYAWSAGFLAEQQALPGQHPIPMLRYPWPGAAGDDASREGQVPAVPLEMLRRWLQEHRPEVVMGHTAYVLPQLERLGRRVPADLAFVDPSLDVADGSIAGVVHNSRRVGELAVEILSGQLQHNVYGLPQFPTVTLVEGSWCEGHSLPSEAPARMAGAVAGG